MTHKTDETDPEAIARDVIATEIAGLSRLRETIDGRFSDAVECLLNLSGHVIVVGIGKSGHIGRKIAASLASTGTPAFFMHPSEAAHGDLGMMVPGTAVLALSFSGESAELSNVLDYANRLSLPVITITGRPISSLAKKSQCVLELPDADEACPNHLAPTTSSMMMLAMGDALTVALMQARCFTAEDFGQRHPAGKLGLGLRRVSEYLAASAEPTPLIAQTAAMPDIILAMTSGGKGLVGVTAGERLTGIITDGDLRRKMDGLLEMTAGDVMSVSPTTVGPDALAEEALAIMNQRQTG